MAVTTHTGQDTHERDEYIRVPVSRNPESVTRMRMKWPIAHLNEEWQQFNQDGSDILKTLLKKGTQYTMTIIIIS